MLDGENKNHEILLYHCKKKGSKSRKFNELDTEEANYVIKMRYKGFHQILEMPSNEKKQKLLLNLIFF